ncbi:MAG: hypothetical protein K6C40_00060 [Thermoguttaceae bacterium]|nr:hypothetical protein [Thermoguttaceae bacterium]
MNRLFFALVLLFCLVSPSFCRDFGEKPLEPEAQAKLDALIEKLSDTSSKKREKTIGEILKFGDRAIETLQKAQSHPDFTVAECAKYCLSLLARGIVRSDDSPRVQKVLVQYDSCQTTEKMILLMGLSQLPPEESIIPLMRIVMHEKDPGPARFSALAVLWALPFTQPVPQFSLPVPESKTFPDPEEWAAQNELNRAKRQKTLGELREYLASESVYSEGKRLLERFLELEKGAQAENADASPFEETFQSLYEELNKEDPIILAFLHEFLFFSVDLLAQNGHEKEAEAFFLGLSGMGLTTFGKGRFQISNERTLILNYRILLIQRLIRRGLWSFVPQEIAQLNKDISDTEKKRLLKEFTSALSMIGEFNTAREYAQNVKRLNFLRIQKTTEQEEEDEESIRMNQQIAQLQALDACKKKDYAKAKEVLVKILEAKGEPDVDLLILARKIAVFTKDPEWLEALDKRIDEVLDRTEKSIQSESMKLLCANQMNTFAWLAANTERRLDEALSYSKESVRLLPDSPGIEDTLATVYFARGDFEKAFETQTQAVEEGSAEMELWVNLERIRVYLNEKKSEKVETTP